MLEQVLDLIRLVLLKHQLQRLQLDREVVTVLLLSITRVQATAARTPARSPKR